MVAFNPNMLKLARQYRSISQTELAKRSHTAQGSLSKIELGILEPKDDVLEKIAGSLDFPVNFFYQLGHLYPPATPFHRKRSSITKKETEYCESVGNIFRLIINKLLDTDLIEYDLFNNHFDVEEYGSAKEVAKVVRRAMGLPRGPIDNMTDLLEDNGIFVVQFNFPSTKLNAFTLLGDNTKNFLVLVNSLFSADNIRLSLAHELGHIVMHQIPIPEMEDQAWEFANEFLMPEDEILPYLSKARSLKDYFAIKEIWKVSAIALIRRSKELGIIDDRKYKSLNVLISQYNYRKKEPVDIPNEPSTLLNELLAVYSDKFNFSKKDMLRALNLHEDDYNNLMNINRRLRIVK